jgi:hypothetical protein
MGLWERFRKFNHDIFLTEKGDEPAIQWAYYNDGKGNKGFKIDAFGSRVQHQERINDFDVEYEKIEHKKRKMIE